MFGGRSAKVDIYSTADTTSRDTLTTNMAETSEGVPMMDYNPSARGDAPPGAGYESAQSDTLNRTLHQCARDGDVKNMKELLSFLGDRKKRLINKWDENKMTPLHYAARYNHFDVTKVLVENGANVDHPGEDKQKPLHYAAKYKKYIKKSLTVDSQLAEHAGTDSEPNITFANGTTTIQVGDNENESTQRPLAPSLSNQLSNSKTDEVPHVRIDLEGYQVSSESVIGYLVGNGADPNCRDVYGSAPLHFAAMRDNDVGLMDLLCQSAILIDARDKQQMTPLHLAATHDNQECCRLLISKGAQLRSKDDENQTALHMAATEGNLEVIEMILEEAERRDGWVTIQDMLGDQDNEKTTPLHLAIENGHYEVSKLFIEKNANVNRPCDNYVTPLHLAATSGDLRIVTLLVENSARVDALDGGQSTPLHRATKYNHHTVIEYLVKKGAGIERADKDNFTPLLIASSEGHVEAIQTLIKLGANLAVTDRDDKNCVFWACQENNPEAVKALLSTRQGRILVDTDDRYGNQPLHVSSENGFLECAQLVLEAGAYIDDKNDEEKTPLHLASERGMTHIVTFITKRDRTTINNYDENSNTPLHLAALAGHNKVANVLLATGADIVARNCNLWTPIDCAAAMGHVKMIKILLEADSPVDPMDRGKITPLHLASKNGHPEVVKLLIERGASVTSRTSDEYNCMDLAIDAGHKDVVRTILNSDRWMEAMKHTHLDLNTDGMRITPTRKLIKKMPDLAEELFHKCTTSNGVSPESKKFAITFNYELLDDQYSSWGSRDGTSRTGESSSFFEDSVYGDDQKVKSEAQLYSNSKDVIKKNHPLMIMVRSQREDLLAHPLVTSLLRHKWHTVGRYFYYFNLITYSVLLIFLTCFALILPSPSAVVTGIYNSSFGALDVASQNNLCADQWLKTSIYERRVDETSQLSNASRMFLRWLFLNIGIYIILILVGFKMVSELFQLCNAKLGYLGWENLLEWCLYILTVLFVIPLPGCVHQNGSELFIYREPWQYQIGIMATFLAWMELILFIRKLPRFGIYVVMFTHILSTFLQFFVVFFLFLVGFAISLHLIFANQGPFKQVENSLIKTAIMMIGEFDFDSIFNAADDGVFVLYPEIGYILFIFFVIIMSILIMNLLVGLAVDDIKGVQDQAVLTRMAMQVELALTVESMLPEFITKRQIMRVMKVRPNANQANCCGGAASSIISGLDSTNLTAALNPELDDIERVMEQQEKLEQMVYKLTQKTKDLRSQNQRLESMMTALIKHSGAEFTDIDGVDDDESNVKLF